MDIRKVNDIRRIEVIYEQGITNFDLRSKTKFDKMQQFRVRCSIFIIRYSIYEVI